MPVPDLLAGEVVPGSVVRMKSSLEAFSSRRHGTEDIGIAIGEVARGHALARRGLQHLLAVLVGAGQEEDVIAVESLEARDGVGRDQLVGMADMGPAIRVGDRGGDVIRVAFGHLERFHRLARSYWR